MKVTSCPSVERLSATSDFDEKLVTSWSFVAGTPFWELFGTSSELTSDPDGVTWSRKSGDVTPKLASTVSLFQTNGYEPSAIADPQPLVQPGGRTAPTWTLAGLLSYTLRLTSRFPGWK